MQNPVKALVTGATGFVGSHVARRLLAEGFQVRIMRRPSSSLKLLEDMTVEHAIGDVTDRDSVFAAVKGCDAVFHAAGLVSFWNGNNAIQKKVNVDGTRNIVEACLKHKIKRLIYTSSIVTIGFSPEGKLSDEETEYNWRPTRIHYSDTKHMAEEEIQRGVNRGLDAVCVNPGIVLGPGDINMNLGAVVVQMALGKVWYYTDGGGCVCDVEDVADGHILAYRKGKTGNRYILGGHNYTWKKIVSLMAEVLNVRPPSRRLPTWLFSLIGYGGAILSHLTKKEPLITPELVRFALLPLYYSSDKAIRDLGYKISPFQETVRRAYDWYKDNGFLKKRNSHQLLHV